MISISFPVIRKILFILLLSTILALIIYRVWLSYPEIIGTFILLWFPHILFWGAWILLIIRYVKTKSLDKVFNRIFYKIIGFIAIFLSLFYFTFVFLSLMVGCTPSPYLSNKSFSPGGTYFVQAEDQNCGGALGTYTADVTIHKTNPKFLDYADDRSGSLLFVHGSASKTKIRWIDSRTVKITYSDCSSVYSENDYWKDVKVIYEGGCTPYREPILTPQ